MERLSTSKVIVVHTFRSGVGWLKISGWFYIIYCNQVPVRQWQKAWCAAFLVGKRSSQPEWALGAAVVALQKGKKEEGEEGGTEGLLSSLTCSTGQLAGAGCNPQPGSWQKCLNLHAMNSWWSLPFKSENQGLTNPVQKVITRPAWLLLVTPIFFYLSHLPLGVFVSCHACCSASIMEVTAAKNPLSLLTTLAFHFSPQAAPCSMLGLECKRQQGESGAGTPGLGNSPTKRKKSLKTFNFSSGSVSWVPRRRVKCWWQSRARGAIRWRKQRTCHRYRGWKTRVNIFSGTESMFTHVTPQLHTPLSFQTQQVGEHKATPETGTVLQRPSGALPDGFYKRGDLSATVSHHIYTSCRRDWVLFKRGV